MIGAAAGDLAARPGAPFGEHEVPPPSERERGELLRALASNAIRGALERHFGVVLAFQNCHRVAAFAPQAVDSDDLPRVRLAARPGAQPDTGAARLLSQRGGPPLPAGTAALVSASMIYSASRR